MLPRAAVAAALALLISGDVARLGWEAIGLWRFLFPFLSLFLFIEIVRARRRVEDGEVFLLGAAAALLYAGVYTKSLQHGLQPLGVYWMRVVEVAFDGGMTAVLSLQVLAFARPRAKTKIPNAFLFLGLAAILAGAACVYAIKTSFNFYQGETLMRSTLFGDVLFIMLAGALIRRAKKQSEASSSSGREPWIFALAAVVVWLPGGRFIAHLCLISGLRELGLYTAVGIWTVGIVVSFRKLWLEPRETDIPAVHSREAAGVAMWRACGTILLVLIIGSMQTDGRAEGMLAVLIDLPTRAVFAFIFAKYRLKV